MIRIIDCTLLLQRAPIQGSCSEGLITMSKRLDPLLNSGGPRAFFILIRIEIRKIRKLDYNINYSQNTGLMNSIQINCARAL